MLAVICNIAKVMEIGKSCNVAYVE